MASHTGTLSLAVKLPGLEGGGYLTPGATPIGTDTSNAFAGLDLGGFGIALIETAVSAPPFASPGPGVDKAVPLPLPTLVKGRPT